LFKDNDFINRNIEAIFCNLILIPF